MRVPAPSLLLLGLLSVSLASAVSAKGNTSATLKPEHEDFLRDAQPLLTRKQEKTFRALAKDYQRAAFIRRFWKAWDPTPGTPENEFKERYYGRLAEAADRFTDLRDDRFRVYVLNGGPGEVWKTDVCMLTWPIEVWRYGYSEHVRKGFVILFTQLAGGGPFRIWHPAEGVGSLGSAKNADGGLPTADMCETDVRRLVPILEEIVAGEGADQDAASGVPRPTDPEWLARFHAFSTDAGEAAGPLAAELDIDFTGRRGGRVVVEGRLEVARGDAASATVGNGETFNFQLTGEVLRQGELFDSFQYRFDFEEQTIRGDRIPMLFERLLRPGDYRLIVKLVDLNGRRELRRELGIDVPTLAAVRGAERLGEEETVEPGAAAADASVELVAEDARLKAGPLRFQARVAGREVRKVVFLLDGRRVVAKTRPPYSVEVDLGPLPRRHRLRVLALAEDGRELATDEIVLNPVEQAFAVRLIEPRAGRDYDGRLRLRAEARAPAGRRVERVELFVNETRVATLYQRPYSHPVEVARGDGLAFARAVAYLDDGHSAEDLVIFNSSAYGEEVEVRLVELFTSVVDRAGRALHDLVEGDFEVLENGAPQRLLRFERLDDLPLFAGFLIDTSASMSDDLEAIRAAALAFFDRTIRERDRAAVITFSEKPMLATDFTSERAALAGSLAGLEAERTTALWDSVVYGVYHLRGIRGQRALIVLSDGEDRASRHTVDEALRYAQMAGVTVYTIAVGSGRITRARRRLARLAVESGGQSFAVRTPAGLGEVYASIERDLRSRYLLVYQSTASDPQAFRAIAVRLGRPGLTARTLRGYYP